MHLSSRMKSLGYETTWRCHQNPFIGALGIQEPVIPGEPLIKGLPMPGNRFASSSSSYRLGDEERRLMQLNPLVEGSSCYLYLSHAASRGYGWYTGCQPGLFKAAPLQLSHAAFLFQQRLL